MFQLLRVTDIKVGLMSSLSFEMFNCDCCLSEWPYMIVFRVAFFLLLRVVPYSCEFLKYYLADVFVAAGGGIRRHQHIHDAHHNHTYGANWNFCLAKVSWMESISVFLSDPFHGNGSYLSREVCFHKAVMFRDHPAFVSDPPGQRTLHLRERYLIVECTVIVGF